MRAELKEYQAVEAAAMKFVKSVAEGNSTYAKELFTDEAVLFGYLDGKLQNLYEPPKVRATHQLCSSVSVKCLLKIYVDYRPLKEELENQLNMYNLGNFCYF